MIGLGVREMTCCLHENPAIFGQDTSWSILAVELVLHLLLNFLNVPPTCFQAGCSCMSLPACPSPSKYPLGKSTLSWEPGNCEFKSYLFQWSLTISEHRVTSGRAGSRTHGSNMSNPSWIHLCSFPKESAISMCLVMHSAKWGYFCIYISHCFSAWCIPL